MLVMQGQEAAAPQAVQALRAWVSDFALFPSERPPTACHDDELRLIQPIFSAQSPLSSRMRTTFPRVSGSSYIGVLLESAGGEVPQGIVRPIGTARGVEDMLQDKDSRSSPRVGHQVSQRPIWFQQHPRSAPGLSHCTIDTRSCARRSCGA